MPKRLNNRGQVEFQMANRNVINLFREKVLRTLAEDFLVSRLAELIRRMIG
jgi:hypothetical protein